VKSPWSRPKTVLYDEPGGILFEHVNRWIALARSGDDVEIRGPCTSACTMIMAYVPKERLCFGDYASLQFHLVRFADTGKMDLASSLWMLNRYPGNIRDWLMARGGVASMSIQDLWTLEAEELLDMGYRKCEYEPAPLMTKLRITTAPMPSLPLPKSALQQYRQKHRRCSSALRFRTFQVCAKDLRAIAGLGLRLRKRYGPVGALLAHRGESPHARHEAA
jgi:hypothetical protein